MRDPNDIIAEAAYPCIKLLADGEYHVSLARMYKIVSEEHKYQDLCRLMAAIGRHNPSGLLLIQADFNARCHAALETMSPIALADLNRELQDVPQSILERRDPSDRKKEILEAITGLYNELNKLHNLEVH